MHNCPLHNHSQPVCREVFDELAPAERAAVLRFVTSCGRAPLGGFKHLQVGCVWALCAGPACVLVGAGFTDTCCSGRGDIHSRKGGMRWACSGGSAAMRLMCDA